jgi:ComF family protein
MSYFHLCKLQFDLPKFIQDLGVLVLAPLRFICHESCRICGDERTASVLCSGCINKLRFDKEQVHRQELWLARDVSPAQNANLMVLSGGLYEGDLRKLLRRLKYNRDKKLACDLAHWLFCPWVVYAASNRDIANSILVPIPLHKERLKSRGFNQAQLLALELSKLVKAPVSISALERVRETSPQYKLSRTERTKNLERAFRAKPQVVAGEHIVLIDDVYTTGATLKEAASALLAAGAESVTALTAAYAPERMNKSSIARAPYRVSRVVTI